MKTILRSGRSKGFRPVGAALLAAGLFLTGCGEKAPAPAQRPVVSGVTVASLAPTVVDEFYEAAGTVKAAQVSDVASRTMGPVTSLMVREGDHVEKGQLLLTLDDADLLQKVKAAEAAHREAAKALEAARQGRELADVTYERYKRMYDQKAISRQEMDQFETQRRVALLEQERLQEAVNRAAAALAEARILLSFARVTSPVKGRVTEKRTEVGSMAIPGMPLLRVESTTAFQAEIPVDESLSGDLHIGVPVTVTIEALDKRYTGRIAEVLPAVDPLSRSFLIKVPLAGPGLRSGLYAKVRIARGKREVLLAPRAAIVEKGQLTGLYTVDGRGLVTYRLVRTGKSYDGRLEILSGLKPGDRIIVDGVLKAVDGGLVAPAGR